MAAISQLPERPVRDLDFEEICAEDKPRAPAEVSGELGNVNLDV